MYHLRRFSGRLLTGVLLGFAAWSSAEEVLFQSAFDTPESVSRWGKRSGVDFVPGGGPRGTGAVRFTSARVGDVWLQIPLPVDRVRGRAVQLEGWLKAQKIAVPTPRYLGPKLMLNIQAPGENSFAEQNKLFGSHDWKKFRVYAQIPGDATKLTLSLGLQHTTGTLEVADVKVIVVPRAGLEKFVPPAVSPQRTTRYRGAMSGFDLTPADLRDFAGKFGGNLIRWQFLRGKSDLSSEAKYQTWLDERIAKLDAVMPALRQYGLKVVIDLHAGPGMEQNALLSNRLSWNPASQDALTRAWKKIARHYRGNDRIYGYDLLNEPYEDNYVYEPDGALDWNRLAVRLAHAIRAVDPITPIVIEPAKWGGPSGLKSFQPINLPHLIYSIHFYEPHAFTHQGIGTGRGAIRYPGKIEGVEWNREKLREKLQPAVDFQRRYNVPIYVGEFSAIRWAPGAAQYLDDCISLFEEYGWDWTYHAYREWNGWSVEHSADRTDNRPTATDTDRKQVLLKWYARNHAGASEKKP